MASMNTSSLGIASLPMELRCKIFCLVIAWWEARRDRCRLSLVCRLWREWIEGSALLWTDISANDGPTYIRRALEKSQGATIDLHYGAYKTLNMTLDEFLAQAEPHIVRWRSLTVMLLSSPRSWERTLTALMTARAPGIKTLHLRLIDLSAASQDIITIFDGTSAPPNLKNLALHRIPVAIGPSCPSGLLSLELTQIAISTPILFEILRTSPGLEELTLSDNSELAVVESRSLCVQSIQLPKLKSLEIRRINHGARNRISHGAANCILSTIRIPNRDRVFISANLHAISVRSVLFTSTIAHLLHKASPNLDPRLSDIRVEVEGGGCCKILFRGIELVLNVRQVDQIQDVLGWLGEGLGSAASACPVRLILASSAMDPVGLASVPPPLIVKHLSISGSSAESLYAALSRPPDSISSGWVLGQMESLCVRFNTIQSQNVFVAMLRSRYGGVKGESGPKSRGPVRLQSVELKGSPRTEVLVDEIIGILGEAEVYWTDAPRVA